MLVSLATLRDCFQATICFASPDLSFCESRASQAPPIIGASCPATYSACYGWHG